MSDETIFARCMDQITYDPQVIFPGREHTIEDSQSSSTTSFFVRSSGGNNGMQKAEAVASTATASGCCGYTCANSAVDSDASSNYGRRPGAAIVAHN